MAYTSGFSLSDYSQILNQIRTFAVSNGYTQEHWDTSGGINDTWLCLSKGGVYYHFWTQYSTLIASSVGTGGYYYIYMKMATGLDTGANPWQQPGTWASTYNDLRNGTVLNLCGAGTVQKYHIFMDDEEITVSFLTAEGWWRHLGFGVATDIYDTSLVGSADGAYVWGGYIAAASNSFVGDANSGKHYTFLDKGSDSYQSFDRGGGVIRFDIDSTPQYHHGGIGSYLGTSSLSDPTGGDCSNGMLQAPATISGFYGSAIENMTLVRGANRFGLLSYLQPINVYITRLTNRFFLAGRLAHIRAINMEFYTAEQEVTVGSDTWVVFPLAVQSNVENWWTTYAEAAVNTWIYGFVVKKTV